MASNMLKRSIVVARVRSFGAKNRKIEPVQAPNPFASTKQKCVLCALRITPDYKNVALLSQFQSGYTGQLYSQSLSGLCAAKHNEVTTETIRAHMFGLTTNNL